MKRSLLLFSRTSVENGLADPEALCDLFNQTQKIETRWAYFDDLLYFLENDKVPQLHDTRNDCDITDYDSVYFRHWGGQESHAIAAARICQQLDVPFVDTEVLRRGSQNKLTQYANLHAIGVAIPKTLMGTLSLLIENREKYGFDYPYIVKHSSGTRGSDNYLIKSQADIANLVNDFSDQTFVLQEFLPNDGDYRVIVLGDAVKLIIKRTSNGQSHLNNTSQGGSAEIVSIDTLPEQVVEDCVNAAQFYGRSIAGVDIVQSKADGKHYCFEVNRAPQIEHASFEHEKAALIAEYLSLLTTKA